MPAKKKSKKGSDGGVLGKRKKRPVELVYEEEHETERVSSKRRVAN